MCQFAIKLYKTRILKVSAHFTFIIILKSVKKNLEFAFNRSNEIFPRETLTHFRHESFSIIQLTRKSKLYTSTHIHDLSAAQLIAPTRQIERAETGAIGLLQ
jgi:hypothetical protein